MTEAVVRKTETAWSFLLRDKMGFAGLLIFAFFVGLALLAPEIALYDPWESHYDAAGNVKRLLGPSWEHPLGTTRLARDVFSQIVMGSQVALLVGILSALLVVFVGMNIGMIAGYFGGRTDQVLMRLTDIVYGVPFLPFALILVALLGPGIENMILAIVSIMWRSSARVIRSQVLTLKTRPYIEAARASGAGHLWILYKHIAPNVFPLALVYMALAMAWGIMTEASLSFLGFGDPQMVSWGQILFNVYNSQAMYIAWWWVIPPGVAITLLVLSGFLMGRAYEEVINPRLRQ